MPAKTSRDGQIYLIHFDRPYRHARHYVGWAIDVSARLREHESGHGARLLAVIRAAGIGFRVVRVWDGSRTDERRIKNMKCAPKLCPVCNPTRGTPDDAQDSVQREATIRLES